MHKYAMTNILEFNPKDARNIYLTAIFAAKICNTFIFKSVFYSSMANNPYSW